MRGIIIGGGIAGLTAAIAFQQKGIAVEVYEQAATNEAVGAGIILAINAVRILDKLGLTEALNKVGNALTGLQITDEQLQPLSKNFVPYFLEKYGYANLSLHRADLQDILLKYCNNIPVHWNKKALRISQDNNHISVLFEDSTKAEADFVIAADGIHSTLRDQYINGAALREAGQMCWRGITDFDLPEQYLHTATEAWGKGVRFGFDRIRENQVYWFAVINRSKTLIYENQPLKPQLTSNYLAFDPIINRIIEITPEDNIIRNDIIDLIPAEQWYNGRLCCIGDAAHATTPNMGQGACQAIEDAYVIADCLAKAESNPQKAFMRFQQIREPRTEYITKLSWQIGKIAHWQNPIMIALRNWLMKVTPEEINRKQFEKIFIQNYSI